MKKLFLVLFACGFISAVCFAESEETAESQAELSMQEAQFQLLQALNEEQNDIEGLDILQDYNETVAQANENIVKEEERAVRKAEEAEQRQKEQEKKAKKEKWEGKSLSYLSLGASLPLHYQGSFDNATNTSSPYGISAQYTANLAALACKANFNCDFAQYPGVDGNSVTFVSLSAGIAPVHNYYLFLGLFGTLGFETIGDYTYTNLGGSGTLVVAFAKKWGLFVNLDATYRVAVTDDEEDTMVASTPRFLETFRICPSVGIALRPFH